MGKDLSVILTMSRALRLITLLKTAMTVGIIAYTVFKIAYRLKRA